MNVAFLAYWSINEGLTKSTVLPHVTEILSIGNVEKVQLYTIEREGSFRHYQELNVVHVPLVSKKTDFIFLDKTLDFIRFSYRLITNVKSEGIDLLICRSSLAGGIGLIVKAFTGVPLVVESFEPHADYMVESNVWKKHGARYWVGKALDYIQKKRADFLLPVSKHYADVLVAEGVQSRRVFVVPCVVDLQLFRIHPSNKRIELGVPAHAIVGIYVGKFGGLYYDQEAFEIFAQAKTIFACFRIWILTPDNIPYVEESLAKAGFSSDEYFVTKAERKDLPNYLNAADFAFATYYPSKSKRFISPIKIGEYWACGLPVFLTDGVGDDSDIIKEKSNGVLFKYSKKSINQAFITLKEQLKRPDLKANARELAMEYRNPAILKDAYRKLFEQVMQ